MKILLTGANGYIGMRLLPALLEAGHQVVCAVRDRNRFWADLENRDALTVVEIDFLEDPTPGLLPDDLDAAYFLLHSMSSSTRDFHLREARTAENFNRYMEWARPRQVIYLSGLVNEEQLSRHLQSRKDVEGILYQGPFSLTVLRAGIIVGSGSSSFEIIRDLCEKLPVMVTPQWVLTRTQPVSIRDVIAFLTGVLGRTDTYGQSFDIGGPDVLNYKEMLRRYARVRGFRNWIFTVPVMTPRLSSYWLYFVTNTSYKLAVNLVDSMKTETVARDNRLARLLGIEPLSYDEAIRAAFKRIDQNAVISSWKDSLVSGRFDHGLGDFAQVPQYGVLRDYKSLKIADRQAVLDRVWRIGGERGWYYANRLWQIRGFVDKLIGGVGLRRGRTHPDRIYPGEALDFWRVLVADREQGRLLLFAEMKLPGEAWLEFRVDGDNTLHQNATFRPRGLVGRLYWYSMLPFHFFIFRGMIRRIGRGGK